MAKMSTYQRAGIPDALAVIVTVLCLILLLSPYAAGLDFGIFKVPTFFEQTTTVLQWVGPFALLVSILLFLPLHTIGNQVEDSARAANTPVIPSLPVHREAAMSRSDSAFTALRQLPPPPRDFTGRETEIKELLDAVTKGGVTISGLRGMGGIGKTALALVLADQLKLSYPDAQFYLDLKGADEQQPLTVAEALSHVIRAYQPTATLPDNEAELSGLYQSVLDGKRALLLMDNARDAKQVELLIPPQSCILLVTSRQDFALPGMVTKYLNVLSTENACALLLKIASRIGDQAVAIAKLCGNLPFALRLAGSAIATRRTLTSEDYVQRLTDAKERLKLIEAPLSLSYDLLDERLQKLWSTLAVFPTTFDEAAAAAVWQLEPGATQDRLNELLTYSLVEWNEGSDRYDLHDLAQLFADSKLDDAVRGSGQRLHAQHYEAVLRAARKQFEQGGDLMVNALTRFDLEWPNIQAGQSWAEAHAEEDDMAAELCNRFPEWPYLLHLRLHPEKRIQWTELALIAARHLKDRSSESAHLGNLGNFYLELGQFEQATEYFEQALDIARELGESETEVGLLGNLGNVYKEIGQTARAIEFLEQALDIARELGFRSIEANALSNLGVTYADQGQLKRAIELYGQALDIARELGDRSGEGSRLSNLGSAYRNLGQEERAIEFLEQALDIARELGDRRAEATTRWNLGLVYEKGGKLSEAIVGMQVRVDYFREIGHPDADQHAAYVEAIRARLKE